MSTFEAAANRLTDWLRQEALPFWASSGADPKGGFWESLNLDGSPIRNSPRRVRVQARMCYVYAHAAYLDWFDGARAASDHGWHYLTTKGLQGGEAGCAHLLNPDGSVQDPMRDTYAQAFLILACAWRWRAFKDESALRLLRQTVDFLDHKLRAQNGGWLEGAPPHLPRRQNSHMHLFEAFLTAYEATDDDIYLERAGIIFDLFKKHFFDRDSHIIHEYFDENWSLVSQSHEAIEPGHMFEWSWILNWYARYCPGNASKYAVKLFRKALIIGPSVQTGLIVNKVCADGTISDGQSRLWPQTEYIKAASALHAFGDANLGEKANQMVDRLFCYFFDTPKSGGWHDLRHASGQIASDIMPTSTFYHIFGASAVMAELV